MIMNIQDVSCSINIVRRLPPQQETLLPVSDLKKLMHNTAMVERLLSKFDLNLKINNTDFENLFILRRSRRGVTFIKSKNYCNDNRRNYNLLGERRG